MQTERTVTTVQPTENAFDRYVINDILSLNNIDRRLFNHILEKVT